MFAVAKIVVNIEDATQLLKGQFPNPGWRHRRLRIANAGMKTIGAKAIAAALCANHTLETVDLSGNNFGCKADDNAWESAAELLSFGLQARHAVYAASLVAFRNRYPARAKLKPLQSTEKNYIL